MVSVILIGLTVGLIFYRIYKYMFYRPEGFPPGPPRLPPYGSYLLLLFLDSKDLHKAVLKLCRYYKTKILGLYIGPFLTIVANDYESGKEILDRSEFDGRPGIFLAQMRDPNYDLKGIFFTESDYWKEQRRFVLRNLRDFGFGRRFDQLEIEIRDELCALLNIIKDGPKYPHEHEIMRENNQVLCPNFVFAAMGNLFLKVFCGYRIPRAEQGILFDVGKNTVKFQRNGDDYGKLLSLTPWIRHIFPNSSSYNNLKSSNGFIYNFIASIIDKHIETYDENHERNFLDIYIKRMLEEKAQGGLTSFSREQLILAIMDFFFPAISAIPMQFSFFLQHMLHRPEILNRLQKEISDVVGDGRLPTLDDRINMPYAEATIREVLRFETLVPSSIPHKSLEDTTYRGYKVPKGTIMISALFAMHKDKSLWKDPENFRPERFLNENGKLDLKLDKSLPFGAGKRLCAGETFARNAFFLLTTTIIQNFNIKMPGSELPPNFNSGETGIIRTTPDYWVTLEAR